MSEWMDELLDDDEIDEVDELRHQLAASRYMTSAQASEIIRLKREQWQMLGAFGVFVVVAVLYIAAVWPGGC
jgi:hypothetical protein